MKKYIFLGFMVFVSCMAGHKIMSADLFYNLDVGMSESSLLKEAGKPYAVRNVNGKKEYEYIERIQAGGQTVETRHYYFLIEDSKVIDKRVNSIDDYKPILERNAYDLQTSSNDR